jgi:hypothetical protein
MSTRAENPQAYAARRAYFKRRAVVGKLDREGSMLAVERMTDAQLLNAATRRAIAIETAVRDLADPQLMRDAQDAVACLLEMEVRGTQLQFDLHGEGSPSD